MSTPDRQGLGLLGFLVLVVVAAIVATVVVVLMVGCQPVAGPPG